MYYYIFVSSRAAKIFVGQVGNLRPIVNRPAAVCGLPLCGAGWQTCGRLGGALWARPSLWGSQSWLQAGFQPASRRARNVIQLNRTPNHAVNRTSYTIDPKDFPKMSKASLTFIAVASSALLFSPRTLHGQQGGRGAAAQPAGRTPTIEERTAGMQKLDGYFPLYWDERTGNLWLEIPRFNADFLYTTGLAAGLGSNDIGLDRGSEGAGRLVSFQRVGPRVMMVQPNESFRSSSANAAERRSV